MRMRRTNERAWGLPVLSVDMAMPVTPGEASRTNVWFRSSLPQLARTATAAAPCDATWSASK